MHAAKTLSGVIAILVVFAARPVAAGDGPHGQELLAPLKSGLKQALIAGMQDGPVNAISVCSDEAPMIAASLAKDDVRMGRTSHRLRNPRNAGPDWATTVLASYLEADTEPAPKVVDLPGNKQGYVEPIMTQGLCLACHGEDLAPDVAAEIAKAYPDDQAKGFELGELRGIFWVEYSTSELDSDERG